MASSNNDSMLSKMKNKFMDLFPTSSSNNSGTNKNTSKSNTHNNNSGFIYSESLGNTINAIQEKVIGNGNVLLSNYILVVSFVLAFLIIILLYFFSNSFRTSRTLDGITMYYQYQNISSFNIPNTKQLKLADVYVASSYNSTLVGYQMFDYVNELILKSILRAGVRYIEFNIFNSEFGVNAIPIVSNGYKNGAIYQMFLLNR